MNKSTLSPPTISIITRSCNRPQKLKRNQLSLQFQTDPDFEQFVIEDPDSSGYLSANTKIFEISDQLNGHYVYILDDDDFLIYDNFIKDFKFLINAPLTPPTVVICKGYIDNKPFPKVWQTKIERGQIGSPNFITRADIFQANAKNWIQKRAGDFYFIKACEKNEDFYWWDKYIFKAE